MQKTKVRELMKSGLALISPDATLHEAARRMQEVNCGFLPVGSNDRPEGIITDRDIVVRAVSQGKNPVQEKVRNYMTTRIFGCREDDTLEEAAKIMNQNNVSRLIVKNSSGKTTGVLSFGRIIREDSNQEELGRVVCCATGRKAA